jgi:Tfp pilus assembly protein FimT
MVADGAESPKRTLNDRLNQRTGGASEVAPAAFAIPELRLDRSRAAGGRGSSARRSAGSLTALSTGRLPVLRDSSAAFTLLEILLAVALLGLLSAALVSGAAHLADGRPQSPEGIFWDATRAARKSALRTQSDVTLSVDAKKKEFVVNTAGSIQSFPLPAIRDLTVDLLQANSAGSALLIGGQLVEMRTLPMVTFYGDGTCQPFRAQFRTNGPANVVAIDPWTCAPVLAEAKTP